MPNPNAAALDFLLSRRSRPARTLALPAPDREALAPILTAGVRVPDHGKLEPWRLVVLERGAMARVAGIAEARAQALGMDPDKAAKGIGQFAESPLCVAVIHVPRSTEKTPAREQELSAANVALSILNAALAAGWGACWLTGWPAYDDGFGQAVLGLRPGEWVVGFVHVGTETSAPPDRPRPDIDAITTWVGE